MSTRSWQALVAVMILGGVGYLGWRYYEPTKMPNGFAGSNGRIEAVEIDVATKTAGRLESVLVNEGDFVYAGQTLAEMDTEVLRAQLHEAEAELRRSRSVQDTMQSTKRQRESEKASADSVVLQRQAELDVASTRFERARRLSTGRAIATEEVDNLRAEFFRSKALLEESKGKLAAAEAAISTAQSMVIAAEASIAASQAKIERIQAEIKDSTLKSPRDGRVQYRIAQPGEVLPAGGKVLNLVDLGDVYMTFYLPTGEAGRVRMGAEARLILDAAPQYVIPAHVSFVADVAQFTPKTVETAEERQKLMFRIKARIEPDLLRKYIRSVKTGLPGMAYVRLNEEVEWPAHLEVKLPQ